MNRIFLAIVPALMLALSACAAWFNVDGFDLRYVDNAPVIEGHRRFMHRGVAVYEIDGHYFRQHGNRWAEYRERPADLVEAR